MTGKSFTVERRPIRTPRRRSKPQRQKPLPRLVKPPRKPIHGAPRMKSGAWDYNAPEADEEP